MSPFGARLTDGQRSGGDESSFETLSVSTFPRRDLSGSAALARSKPETYLHVGRNPCKRVADGRRTVSLPKVPVEQSALLQKCA